MSLVFYDTETTGTETFFDQILQFAAIKTDVDLNETDRIEARCQILPHVVPSPGAMVVNRIRASQLTDPSLPSHYEMICKVRATLLSWAPSLFVGWNSMAFDEHLVRQALYKTLHNPYLTNSGGNTRSDVMRIVQACSLFAPDALVFPTDKNGLSSFKLDLVAPANGFDHSRSHEALGDVEACIHVCRLIMERAPNVWSSFMRYSSKAAVVDYINEELVFCVSDFYYGKAHSCIVTTIRQNGKNKAEWYIYNLAVDPESLKSLTDSQLAARLQEFPKPVRKLKANGAPMLFPVEDAPDVCRGREHGLEVLERRAARLRSDSDLLTRIIAAFESEREEYAVSSHVEKQIYDGFTGDSDGRLMEAFHRSPWPNRPTIVGRFNDSRLSRISTQLIHLERPDLLKDAIRREHDIASAKRLLGELEDVAWLTLPQALTELEDLLNRATGLELEFLREHDRYLRNQHAEAHLRSRRL